MTPLQIGKTAIGVASSLMQSASQQSAANYQLRAQAQQAEYNAQIANRNAIMQAQQSEYEAAQIENERVVAEAEGRRQANEISQRLGATLKQQRSIFAASGLTIGGGSNRAIFADTRKQAGEDKSIASLNATARDVALSQDAAGRRWTATAARQSGSNALAQGRWASSSYRRQIRGPITPGGIFRAVGSQDWSPLYKSGKSLFNRIR